MIESLKNFLRSQFKLKDLGKLKYFLEFEIPRSRKGIFLSQRHYNLQLPEDTGFLACKPALLPMDPKVKLNSFEGDLLDDASLYRRLVGRLLYLTVPQIKSIYIVASPPHLDAVHNLLRCIKAAPGQGLLFDASSSFQIRAFANTDWGSFLIQ